MKRLVFLMLIIAMPQAANAQRLDFRTPNLLDLKIITDCLQSADANDKLGTGCIGLVADPCRARPLEGIKVENDNVKNKYCAERELAVWNAIAASAGKRIRAGGFKEISKALADSEKGWSQQRDTLCKVFDRIDPGTLPGDAAYCRMQTTANRALLLRKLGAAVNEH